MRSSQRNRFTVFDMMDAKGAFSSNPANADSVDPTEGTSLYDGPVRFPMMLYHPTGERRVLVPGEVLLDRDGQPRRGRDGEEIILGRQTEIIFEIAHSVEDEASLRSAGWHDHPAKAIAASGAEAPPISTSARMADLEEQLAAAQEALARARQTPSASGAIKKKDVSDSLSAS